MNRYSKPPRDRYKSYWLSASNYYVLTLAAALAVFFLVMGLLHEGNEEPFIPAGIAASAVLVSAVIVRRAIMKNHQMRVHAARRLENNLASLRANAPLLEKKLTIEKNASILRELKRKSDAATVLAKYADGHREVVELCGRYLDINEREMVTVNPGSPRIAALRRGREIAEEYHRRHMLKWAEIETTSLLEDAQASPKSADKVEYASRALAVIDSATIKYPSERKLVESAAAISEFIIKVKVADLVDRASRAESRGNVKLAIRHFRGALKELNKSSVSTLDRDAAFEKISSELERLGDSELK
jgi:hypothetical protein